MSTEAMQSDKGLGLTILFGAIALGGAALAAAAAGEAAGAYGFGIAMVAAMLTVAAIHVYE